MKILHTADWHIGNFPGPEKDGRNLRLQDAVGCIRSLISVAAQEKPDIALISGDLFHQARVWADRGLSETYLAIELIEALALRCPVVVMRGTPNHDGSEQFKAIMQHFAPLNPNARVWVVDQPKVIEIMLNDQSVINIACLPGFDRGVYRAKYPGLSKEQENQVFTEELGNIVLGLKAQCNPEYPSVLMAHYTVPGCNTESGQTQFLAQFEPVIMPDVLDAAGFDLVALGHIHRPQQVPSCKNTFYSGAINAMNFNDEGQDRGFFIHDLDADAHVFHKTPSRQFVTYHFTDTEITAIILGDIDDVAYHNWKWKADQPAIIDGAIVRILYECSEEKDKAFNRSLLERRLYSDGAFWVSEISPEKITIGTNKNELSEKTDPEANLIDYLREKAYPDDKIGGIVEAARPIISEATAGNITTRLTGAFIPLEIVVKNYRNYEAEQFDFRDISFCTINGRNGAGKSSLFMDAILDCLYEEPREGDLTGWIRADEKARSGSISFTFAIGDKTFRVTRTRAKSGKATLNLSEMEDGEWVNRSAEKIKDTQQQIVDVLGMDSLTFRSCALIMQDQYGLFLQASKEDRMTILGNILGLGVYGDMEQLARLQLSDTNRAIAKQHTIIENLSREILRRSEVEDDFCEKSEKIIDVEQQINQLSEERDVFNLQLAQKRDAAARARKLQSEVDVLSLKKESLISQHDVQIQIAADAAELLEQEGFIRERALEYQEQLDEEKGCLTKIAELDAKISGLADIQRQKNSLVGEIARTENDKLAVAQRLVDLGAKLDREGELKEAVSALAKEKERLSALEKRGELYISLSGQIDSDRARYSEAKSAYSAEAAKRKAAVETFSAKACMLENSGCCDIENANCTFLADAKKAKEDLATYLPECTSWKEREQARLDDIQRGIDTLTRQREGLGYDTAKIKELKSNIAALEISAREYEQLESVKEQIGLLEERLSSFDSSISDLSQRLAQVNDKALDASKLAAERETLQNEYSILKTKLAGNKQWVEKERQVPVAKERQSTALQRASELSSEIEAIGIEAAEKLANVQKEIEAASGVDRCESMAEALSNSIKSKQKALGELQVIIGGLRQQLEQIEQKQAEIEAMQDEVNGLSVLVSQYNTLKAAFGQDGIPHNIIRSMLPMLTATANTILGQMTGGKMGMEFVTDKILKSNSKKEVPTLDIVIEEYGKDSLPYLSKSGGEKVKASLSAILSLAEIKSSQAGIQLGMLFIDEPPFLDSDGIQAYCDALETIQNRYSNLKIMAITHDPTMKARFPQSIDIIKTENGSKVELG